MRKTICPNLCAYYKPEKPDEEGCGGVLWLERRPELAPRLQEVLGLPDAPLFGIDPQDERLLAICSSCPYRVDGCDFRDPQVPDEKCSPCGGLRTVSGLLALGLIAEI